MRIKILLFSLIFSFFIISLGMADTVFAASNTTLDPNGINDGIVDIKLGDEGNLTSSVKILIMIAVLGIAPSLFIMFTCFTQIIIVLSMTRQAIGTPTIPPTQVMNGLALFLTIFIMSPIFMQVNDVAWKPLEENKITLTQAAKNAEVPIKKFMLKNTQEKDLATMLKVRGEKIPKDPEKISIWAAVPAYTISQITAGLKAGLLIYGGFIFIDLIMGNTLMFLGMMMLPPQLISVPLKLLIFIYIGGFNKIIEMLFNTIKV